MVLCCCRRAPGADGDFARVAGDVVGRDHEAARLLQQRPDLRGAAADRERQGGHQDPQNSLGTPQPVQTRLRLRHARLPHEGLDVLGRHALAVHRCYHSCLTSDRYIQHYYTQLRL